MIEALSQKVGDRRTLRDVMLLLELAEIRAVYHGKGVLALTAFCAVERWHHVIASAVLCVAFVGEFYGLPKLQECVDF